MASNEDTWQGGEQKYRAFLLRCWQENELQNGGKPPISCGWRFALVQIDEDKEQGFACLDELLTFLSREFGYADSLVPSKVEE